MSPRHCGVEWGETDERSRTRTRGREPRLPRTQGGLMKAPARRPRVPPSGLLGPPSRTEPATPEPRARPARRGALGFRAPSSHRRTSAPRPPAGDNKLITIIPAQSVFFLDVNHGGAGIARLKGVRGGRGRVGEKKRGLRRGWGKKLDFFNNLN